MKKGKTTMGLFRKAKKDDKKAEVTQEKPAYITYDGKIDLSKLLTEEEINLLLTDFKIIKQETVDDKVKDAVGAMEILVGGNVPFSTKLLYSCIIAVQNGMIGLPADIIPSETTALLEKLESTIAELNK